MINKLKTSYQKLQSTEIFLWLHIFSVFGWIGIFLMYFFYCFQAPWEMVFTFPPIIILVCLMIPFSIFLLIDFFFGSFHKIKIPIFSNNFISNFLWIIGILYLILNILVVLFAYKG